MNEAERRKLETSLIKSGFSGLNDPGLVKEFAKLITSHEILRALLNDCSRLERGAMLEAVRPYLPFKPHPLDWYEMQTAQKFEAWESERNRIIAGDREFAETCKELATHIVVTLKCSKCRHTARFVGESPLGAVILARQDGWFRERGTNKEVCPKCECADRGKRKKCRGCGCRHFAPDCRIMGNVEPGAPLIGGAKENIERLN